MPAALEIGIVAGEPSGDALGAGLIQAIQAHRTDIQFLGIAGPGMQKLGARSLHPMDDISVMGLEGLFGKLRRILRIRRELSQYFLSHPPDLFIGIDVPDFNLALEAKLRRAKIPTVHYVSPTVWAWRGYRIHRIRRSVTKMLTLFPFEEDYYKRHQVPAKFVGHPLADEIQQTPNRSQCRVSLGLPAKTTIIALLPGSRASEVKYLGEILIDSATALLNNNPGLEFIIPCVSLSLRRELASIVDAKAPALPLHLYNGRSREIMAAADIVVLASGTAALEAALLCRPMVVVYKVSRLTELYVRSFQQVEYCSMPNILFGRPVVPELLQGEARPEKIAAAVQVYLDDPKKIDEVAETFQNLTSELGGRANQRAAQTVMELLPKTGTEA